MNRFWEGRTIPVIWPPGQESGKLIIGVFYGFKEKVSTDIRRFDPEAAEKFSGVSENIELKDIHVHSQMAPKIDERFIELMHSALDGKTPIYFGWIPLSLCIPNDPDYRADCHPVISQNVDALVDRFLKKQLSRMIAYPRGSWFVIGDDYPPLFAYIKTKAEYVPCWIMGKPEGEDVQDLQGPIRLEDVPGIFGLKPR